MQIDRAASSHQLRWARAKLMPFQGRRRARQLMRSNDRSSKRLPPLPPPPTRLRIVRPQLWSPISPQPRTRFLSRSTPRPSSPPSRRQTRALQPSICAIWARISSRPLQLQQPFSQPLCQLAPILRTTERRRRQRRQPSKLLQQAVIISPPRQLANPAQRQTTS